MTHADQRTRPGLAIVTLRSSIKWRYESAGIPNRTLPVQISNTWPAYRPPVVLDTIGMPPAFLVDLLADPPRIKRARAEAAAWQPWAAGPPTLVAAARAAPIVALADPSDWRALRLLALCPAVQLVCPDQPATLQRWLPHLTSMVASHTGVSQPGWMLEPAPDLGLDPLLLRALAVLPSAASIRIAAERCAISESTLARLLRVTKATLGLPRGDVSRFRPSDLAAALLDRLGADAPIHERHVER